MDVVPVVSNLQVEMDVVLVVSNLQVEMDVDLASCCSKVQVEALAVGSLWRYWFANRLS